MSDLRDTLIEAAAGVSTTRRFRASDGHLSVVLRTSCEMAAAAIDAILPLVEQAISQARQQERERAEDCYTLLEQSLLVTQNEPYPHRRREHWMKVEAFLRGATFARGQVSDV